MAKTTERKTIPKVKMKPKPMIRKKMERRRKEKQLLKIWSFLYANMSLLPQVTTQCQTCQTILVKINLKVNYLNNVAVPPWYKNDKI